MLLWLVLAWSCTSSSVRAEMLVVDPNDFYNESTLASLNRGVISVSNQELLIIWANRQAMVAEADFFESMLALDQRFTAAAGNGLPFSQDDLDISSTSNDTFFSSHVHVRGWTAACLAPLFLPYSDNFCFAGCRSAAVCS